MTKLCKKDVAEIVQKTYPEYKGRKFKLSIEKTYCMKDYWFEGSRNYVKAMTFDGQIHQSVHYNPITNFEQANGEVTIPDEVMLIEHCIFCGHDLGLTFIVSPNSKFLPKMLPQNLKPTIAG